jgi:thymidine phosphorylase
MLTAPRDGYIAGIATEQIGLASMSLGAGRFQKGDPIDHRTGLVLQAKVGDYLHAGDPLVEIHARNEQEVSAMLKTLLACYQWSATPIHTDPLLHDIIHP